MYDPLKGAHGLRFHYDPLQVSGSTDRPAAQLVAFPDGERRLVKEVALHNFPSETKHECRLRRQTPPPLGEDAHANEAGDAGESAGGDGVVCDEEVGDGGGQPQESGPWLSGSAPAAATNLNSGGGIRDGTGNAITNANANANDNANDSANDNANANGVDTTQAQAQRASIERDGGPSALLLTGRSHRASYLCLLLAVLGSLLSAAGIIATQDQFARKAISSSGNIFRTPLLLSWTELFVLNLLARAIILVYFLYTTIVIGLEQIHRVFKSCAHRDCLAFPSRSPAVPALLAFLIFVDFSLPELLIISTLLSQLLVLTVMEPSKTKLLLI